MVTMASGIDRVRLRAPNDDDDDDNHDDVAQHGGHTPDNRLTETGGLGLPCTFLILDIPLMINRHLSKQGIC